MPRPPAKKIETPRPASRFVLLWTVLSFVGVLSSTAQGQETHIPELGLTIRPGEGWVSIPASVVVQRSQEASSLTGAPVEYVAGFQSVTSDSSSWFDPPFVLYQVTTVDPLTPDDLFTLLQDPTWVEEAFSDSDLVPEAFDSSAIAARKPEWDPELRLLTVPFTMTDNAGRAILGHSVHQVFGKGLLITHYYELARHDFTDEPEARIDRLLARADLLGSRLIAQDLAQSATFSPAMRYKPSPGILGNIMAAALVGGISGGIFGLFGWMRRKRRSRG